MIDDRIDHGRCALDQWLPWLDPGEFRAVEAFWTAKKTRHIG
jgi:hypothetical protein